MRVLHIFIELKFSGAEIMYVNAAPLFQNRGIDLVALSTGEEVGEFAQAFENVNVKVLYRALSIYALNPLTLFKHFKGVYSLVRKENIDVIHIHRSKHFLFYSFIGFILKKKVVRTVHNVFKHRKMTWIKGYLERYIARNLFGVTFQTIGTSVYQNELNYYKNGSSVVNNWYDGERFYPLKNHHEKQQLREELNIPLDATVIISVGGCSHVKNHHDVIKAMPLVLKDLNCFYVHLGQGETENEEKELAKSLGVFNNIHFYGNQNNVRDFLVASDIYVMPSRFEGLGNAALEAMACGLPSILYNVPGLKDLIKNDDNGFLIDESIEILAEKILYLARNPNLCLVKGNKAKEFAQENFSVESGVAGIAQLYTEL